MRGEGATDCSGCGSLASLGGGGSGSQLGGAASGWQCQWPSQCLRASRPKPDQAQVRAWLHLGCKVRVASQGRLRLRATGGEVADSERNN